MAAGGKGNMEAQYNLGVFTETEILLNKTFCKHLLSLSKKSAEEGYTRDFDLP